MKRNYCLMLLKGDAEQTPVVHMHVDAETVDAAMLGMLAACVKDNVSVAGCTVSISVDVPVPPGLVEYIEEARKLNHGPDAAPVAPPLYCDPGSTHFH